MISPKILKGFRDFSPVQQSIRNYCIQQLQEVFAHFCFLPIDTPILEYEEILLGKGGGETDNQVYQFTDKGNRNVAMRFDLTVPFARFVAMNKNELTYPFARYQIGKVFRGENTQKGRYREFIQCDFDIVGTDTFSADLTIIEIIIASLQKLGIQNFKIHISHREIIESMLISQDSSKKIKVMRIIDKLKKIGKDNVYHQLKEILPLDICNTLLDCVQENFNTNESVTQHNQKLLSKIEQYIGKDTKTYIRLQELLYALQELNLENFVILDTSITRGLDYYTGFVCETFLENLEEIGSVCSGGRYNNLTGLYTTQAIPGVGASIGLDRLLSAIEQCITLPKTTTIAIYPMKPHYTTYCHAILQTLHTLHYHAHVYSYSKDTNTTLKDFFKFTDNSKPNFTIVIGSEEFEKKTITITHIKNKAQLRSVNIQTGLNFIHEQNKQQK